MELRTDHRRIAKIADVNCTGVISANGLRINGSARIGAPPSSSANESEQQSTDGNHGSNTSGGGNNNGNSSKNKRGNRKKNKKGGSREGKSDGVDKHTRDRNKLIAKLHKSSDRQGKSKGGKGTGQSAAIR